MAVCGLRPLAARQCTNRERSADRSLPLPLGLTEMSADGRPARLDRVPPKYLPASGRLQIRYSAIHLSAPDQVQYSYKLAGLDSDWVQADTSPRRQLTTA